jgi:hypothetical protein
MKNGAGWVSNFGPLSCLTCIEVDMIAFDAELDRYRHWRLSYDGPITTMTLAVEEDGRSNLVDAGSISRKIALKGSRNRGNIG